MTSSIPQDTEALLQKLAPIKNAHELPTPWIDLMLVVLVACGLLVFLSIVFKKLKKTTKTQEKATRSPEKHWAVDVKERLQILKTENLSASEWRDTYFELSALLRVTLEHATPLKATEMTSQELNRELPDHLDTELSERVARYFHASDLLLFAKQSDLQLHPSADRKLIEEVLSRGLERERAAASASLEANMMSQEPAHLFQKRSDREDHKA